MHSKSQRIKTTVYLLCTLSVPLATLAAAGPSWTIQRIEKTIRSDSSLRMNDKILNSLYRALMRPGNRPASLQMEQRDWLRLRNQCDDAKCLSLQYQKRNVQLAKLLAQGPCTASPIQLQHAWENRDDSGFFYQFELNKDGEFNSWRNYRPDLSGARWRFRAESCLLSIRSQHHEGLNFDYTIILPSPNEMLLLESPEELAGYYVRLP